MKGEGEGLWKSEVLTFKVTVRELVGEPVGPPFTLAPRARLTLYCAEF